MPSRLLSLVAMLWLSCALHAETVAPARFQVFGGYTYQSNTFNGVPGSRQALNGWDAAVGFPAWHKLRFVIDIYGYRGTNLDAPQNSVFFTGGGQYGWKLGRETLFVEALVGDAGLSKNWGANQTTGGTASFATLVGGGVDTRITRRIAFRASAGYQYTYFNLVTPPPTNLPYRIPGLPTNFAHLSTGLVWGF
ncbi:MAG TPA: hypothetical protein VI320_34300 [Terracidiphilus sp.]|jgi:hypothetical protein